MKTKEELNKIKEEIETLNRKLAELTEDEVKQIIGGSSIHGLETIGPYPYFSSGNLMSEGNQKGSINEVIGEWDIHVKLKDQFKEE